MPFSPGAEAFLCVDKIAKKSSQENQLLLNFLKRGGSGGRPSKLPRRCHSFCQKGSKICVDQEYLGHLLGYSNIWDQEDYLLFKGLL